jgi:2-succinyl-6-hydroxy-2,4-cyclohexadiene-1-carboxylate synthase
MEVWDSAKQDFGIGVFLNWIWRISSIVFSARSGSVILMDVMHEIILPIRFPAQSSTPLGLHWPGQGRPLVCLHGFGGCGHDFEALAQQDDRRRPIIALDLPGHGVQRDRLDGLEAFEEMMRDLIAAIDRPFDLLGYSMGGRLALWAALNMDLPIHDLYLIGTTAGARDLRERGERLEFDDTLIQRLEQGTMQEFMGWWRALPMIQSQARLRTPLYEAMNQRRFLQDPAGIQSAIRAFGTGRFSALWTELENLDLPVTLIVGVEDETYQDIAIEMAARLPQSRISMVPGAGHAPHLENPATVLHAL